MALFVLVVVGVVVAQTWLDWRETRKGSPLPSWATGTAMASVVAITLASVASYAAVWIEGSGISASTGSSQSLWPEIGFLLCTMSMIIAAARNKRFRWMFVAAALVVAAFWAGMLLSA